jgi:N4-gp56 family major capsid protein
MAVDTAKSNTTTVSQSIKSRYYDELFLKAAEVNFIHKQLGQKNRQVPKGQGGYGTGVVYWTRFTHLPLVSAGQGEGVPTTAVSMSAVNVTGSTAQYDAAVSISDLLAYTSLGDIMKEAMEKLGYNAGLSIDTLVRNTVAVGGTGLATGGVTAVAWTSIPSTAVITIGDIRRAKRTLDRNAARMPSGNAYIAAIHPDAAYDLQGDTTTGGWLDANKYTTNTPMLTGEIGKLYGVRFLESPNGYVKGTGITTSASVYVTSFFGADAFGVTELQNLRTYVKDFGSGGTGDPTEKVATAGWKTTFGTAVLDSTFMVNVLHAVSSTA